MIRTTLMATELAAMFASYHQPRPEDAALRLLVDEWRDILDDVSDAEFVRAMKKAKKRCRFPPVAADVYAVVEQDRLAAAAPRPALPETTRTPEEQRALNLEGARRILDLLRENMKGREHRA